jgi:CBS domain-containing protein
MRSNDRQRRSHREDRAMNRIGDACVRNVVTVTRSTRVADAAALMRQHHVGALVVADDVDGVQVPSGVITDRDIVVEVVAAGLDPASVAVGEIIQRPVVTVPESASCAEVVREMSLHGVRRLPVVRADGALAGIAALDDVLLSLIAPLVAVGDLAGRERRFEANARGRSSGA